MSKELDKLIKSFNEEFSHEKGKTGGVNAAPMTFEDVMTADVMQPMEDKISNDTIINLLSGASQQLLKMNGDTDSTAKSMETRLHGFWRQYNNIAGSKGGLGEELVEMVQEVRGSNAKKPGPFA